MQSAGCERWMRPWVCLFLCLDSCVGAVGRLEISARGSCRAGDTRGKGLSVVVLGRLSEVGTIMLERTAAKLVGEFRGSGGDCCSYVSSRQWKTEGLKRLRSMWNGVGAVGNVVE
ncbi:hypothetical protein CKAH01_00046 [Colletotrichum kahawae]|uniref:Secreted protein n=1 Tax=Colletotrichum kahawae TaxID=34407 RepID=A0AAE0DE23_COLKA|nr:hypothetical protein CKAH01_00046 [Colletotrichum kahawae]